MENHDFCRQILFNKLFVLMKKTCLNLLVNYIGFYHQNYYDIDILVEISDTITGSDYTIKILYDRVVTPYKSNRFVHTYSSIKLFIAIVSNAL